MKDGNGKDKSSLIKDLQGALDLRDEGMQRVLENAGKWQTIAYQACLNWLSKRRGERVTGEDIRLGCLIDQAIPYPHHHNCWGALIRQLATDGHIEMLQETEQMKTPKSHGRRNPVYRVR